MNKKILCICNHGNVRSVCLARLLKELNGPCLATDNEYLKTYVKYESIAIGAHAMTEQSLKTFINWADKIIDLSDEDLEIQNKLTRLANKKYIRYNIGSDFYGTPYHPELISVLQPLVEKIKNEQKN